MSPLGTVRNNFINNITLPSPMPFGNESAWDPLKNCASVITRASHQCLSAMSPLGTKPAGRKLDLVAHVTNAFRQ